jgi:hypothetical protein
MEIETVVDTPAVADNTAPAEVSNAPDEDQDFINELFGLDEPAPVTTTPEVKAAEAPAKTDTPEGEVDAEHVQVSKTDWMRLMTLEAQLKMKEGDIAPVQAEDAAEAAPAPAQQAAPAVRPDWTPEVTPVPISLSEDWLDAFSFESKEKGDAYIGSLINVPIQKAAEYTQNAVAAVESRMQQQIHAMTTNFGLFSAVQQVLKDRPEYRGEHMAQVEYAAKEAIKADPTLTAWDLPEKIVERLDTAATKAKQIMKSGGKINAVPQGGLKSGSTGARSPQDTGRSEPTVDADLQFARDLGFPG